jgi:hypothetical protein
MRRGVAAHEKGVNDILTAAVSAFAPVSEELAERARQVIETMYAHLTELMRCFRQVGMALNECEYEVSVANAKSKGEDVGFFARLEREKHREDEKLRAEHAERLEGVEEHLKEAISRFSTRRCVARDILH